MCYPLNWTAQKIQPVSWGTIFFLKTTTLSYSDMDDYSAPNYVLQSTSVKPASDITGFCYNG
jgi:hypothetical protein